MLPLKNDAREIKKFAKQFAEAYKDCFAWYSEEKYVRGFATRHFETVCAINEDENDIKISKKNKKLFVDVFSEITLNNILYMREQHNQKEKQDIKKHGIKRKKQKGGK